MKYQACNPKNAMSDAVNMTETVGGTNVSTSQTLGPQGPTASTSILNDPSANKIKSLSVIADRLGCNLVQLQVAWQIRNQTIQCTTISASSPEQLLDLLNGLAVSFDPLLWPLILLYIPLQIIPKLTHGQVEDIDKILGNKPARPPMISTLQQRWATTGGVPPC